MKVHVKKIKFRVYSVVLKINYRNSSEIYGTISVKIDGNFLFF